MSSFFNIGNKIATFFANHHYKKADFFQDILSPVFFRRRSHFDSFSRPNFAKAAETKAGTILV
jgi:hypothetical protein